jgi:hypothetical protein
VTSTTATPRRVLALAGILMVLSLPALVLPGAVGDAAAIYGTIDGAHPYRSALSSAGLVFVLFPLVTFAATVLFLSPGLLLAIALGRTRHVAEWIVSGLLLSIVSLGTMTSVVHAIGGPAPAIRGRAYALVVAGVAILAALVAVASTRRTTRAWPTAGTRDRFMLLGAVGVPALLCVVLAPKLLWESFNGDGAHAYESSRLLLHQAVPFFPESSGAITGFPGITSMLFAFPNAWYLHLFGEVEAAVRVPFLLYLGVLWCAVVVVAEHAVDRVGRGPARGVHAAIWVSILAYAFAMAYSATYSPYNADIALPATQDTLLVISFLAAIHAHVRREWGWFALCTALTYVSLPSGLVLVAMWLLGGLVATRPWQWRPVLTGFAVLFGCMVAGALVPRILEASGAPPPGGEYGLAGILRYFAFLQFTDWRRFMYVAVASGIAPFVVLFFWRRHDAVSRALVITTALYFLFIFVQGYISLHHLVPAMILPVIVAARGSEAQSSGMRVTPVWVAVGAIAVLLSLPRSFAIHTTGREVGRTIFANTGDYRNLDPRAFHASTLLAQLFPYDWDPAVPTVYGGSPLVWNHYARRHGDSSGAKYVLQWDSLPAPPGFRLVARDNVAALWVGDEAVWTTHRALTPPTHPGSAVYVVDRGTLFRSVPRGNGPAVVSVIGLLERAGVDVDPILSRLGVTR